jgi:Lar family restriction alleviation protein
MAEGLLACPFCGENDKQSETEFEVTHLLIHKVICCGMCGAHGPFPKGDETPVDAWNRTASGRAEELQDLGVSIKRSWRDHILDKK